MAQIGMGFKPRASSPLLTCWLFCWAHLAATLPKISPATCLTSLLPLAGQEICLREIPRCLCRAESHQGALGARDRAAEGAPAPGHGSSAGEGVAVQQQVMVCSTFVICSCFVFAPFLTCGEREVESPSVITLARNPTHPQPPHSPPKAFLMNPFCLHT